MIQLNPSVIFAWSHACPTMNDHRACDFFNLACLLWLESFEEHLPTSIAGVLRLRAISRPLCDRSARRFAQDDGFVGGENIRLGVQKTRKDRKSHRLTAERPSTHFHYWNNLGAKSAKARRHDSHSCAVSGDSK